MKRLPIDWTTTRWVSIPAPRQPPPVVCPHCNTSPGAVIIRTMARESDGSQTRRCICRGCGQPYLTILEPEEQETLPELAGQTRRDAILR